MTIKLYHAPRTRSIRVRWLLEEMGLDYTLERVAFDKRPAGDEAYAKINPLRKVPALDDDGMVMIESIAIMEYLMGRYGPTPLALSPDEADYGRYLQWLQFGEAGMLMPVNMLMAHTVLLPEKARDPKLAAWARSETDKLLEYISAHGVGSRQFLAGDRFTAADISVCYMLYLLKISRQFSGAPENVNAYFKAQTQRESWKVASEVEPASA
jgi:glutathione S-transferase